MDKRTWGKAVAVLGIAVLGLMLVGVFGIPTSIWWARGAFQERDVVVVDSPDAKYRFTLSRRAEFPVSHLLHPYWNVSVQLTSQPDGRIVHRFFFGLDDREFGDPKAEWQGSSIRLSRLGRRNDLALTFAFAR
jgi:hypothetical protein